MPRKSPTVMTIQVPVTKAMMQRVAEASFYDLDDYSDEDIRAAGVSSKRLIDDLINDVNFQTNVARQMVDAAQNGIRRDIDYGEITNGEHIKVKTAVKAVEKAHDEREKNRVQREHNERIKDATALLREAGFKVVKA
jgi:hypothetical protein